MKGFFARLRYLLAPGPGVPRGGYLSKPASGTGLPRVPKGPAPGGGRRPPSTPLPPAPPPPKGGGGAYTPGGIITTPAPLPIVPAVGLERVRRLIDQWEKQAESFHELAANPRPTHRELDTMHSIAHFAASDAYMCAALSLRSALDPRHDPGPGHEPETLTVEAAGQMRTFAACKRCGNSWPCPSRQALTEEETAP